MSSICRISVTRPVFTLVMMSVLCLFGVIALRRMPVREYPDIDMPVMNIRTDYTGASSDVVESRITQRIENAVAGIEGLSVISSTSRDGRSVVTLEFDVSRDIDDAANDVRDKLSRLRKQLPDEADDPVVSKYDSDSSPVVVIALSGNRMNRMELTDYADRFLVNRFAVVNGAASVGLWGSQYQSMRVWLDRRAMAARGVASGDIIDALRRENVEYPGGRIESLEREFTVRVKRQYLSAEDFRDLIIRTDEQGNYVRLRDVARAAVEPKSQRNFFAGNGEPMVAISVYKQSRANSLEVSEGCVALVEELRKTLPEGMTMKVMRNEAKFINASITEVRDSLMISAVLVFLIIFLFLGNMRASLIPALTVPISLLAAFVVLGPLGFSINMLTLLALVLAIGMVVDDAIVMVENIHRHIENGDPPLLAAVRGAEQVIFAVIATTVVLAAVFMPICLWEGKTGKLFAEFAVAMTAAVCFSTFVALTLTPMLCSRFLKKDDEGGGVLATGVDFVMSRVERWYEKSLRFAGKYRIMVMGIFFSGCVWVVYAWGELKSEYEPQEDRGVIFSALTAPEGTNFYAMSEIARDVFDSIKIYLGGGEVESIMSYVPGFGGSDGAVNTGNNLIELTDWGKRKRTAREIMDEIRAKLAKVPGCRIRPYLPMGMGSRGSNAVMVSIGGPDYETLVKWRDVVMGKLKDYPGIVDFDCDYKETTPQFVVEYDRERAGRLGISARSIGTTLQTMLGSEEVTTYYDRGQEYDVVLQADRESRLSLSDLNNIFVRSSGTGKLVPLENLITVTERGEAARKYRYNRVRAITISGNVATGYTLSEVLDTIENIVRTELPEYAQLSYRGQSKDLKEAGNSMIFVFLLALFVSYLALAAQFESFVSPLVVMFTVPLGMFGAVMALGCYGYTMNIYTQIGLIMLIGLAAKNGILIVEFANQLRNEGLVFEEALFTAARLRLRPIMMTGISTVAGALPLLLADGAGAVSRRCLGAVVVYGGMSSCLLTLFVVPVGYLLLAKREKPPQYFAAKLSKLEAENAGSI